MCLLFILLVIIVVHLHGDHYDSSLSLSSSPSPSSSSPLPSSTRTRKPSLPSSRIYHFSPFLNSRTYESSEPCLVVAFINLWTSLFSVTVLHRRLRPHVRHAGKAYITAKRHWKIFYKEFQFRNPNDGTWKTQEGQQQQKQQLQH